jgi:CheY-like chemotaxis protein
MSGYNDREELQRLSEGGLLQLMPKPFTEAALLQRVRKMLDRA